MVTQRVRNDGARFEVGLAQLLILFYYLGFPTLRCDLEMGAKAFVVMEGKEYAKLRQLEVEFLLFS